MILQEKDLNNTGAKIHEVHILYRCIILDQVRGIFYYLTSNKIRNNFVGQVQHETHLKFQRKLKSFS